MTAGSPGGRAVVIDASAFLRFTSGSEQAREWLRRAWSEKQELVAPELIVGEVAQALLGYRRAGLVGSEHVHRRLRQLRESVSLVRLAPLAEAAGECAFERGLGACDAFYAVFAEEIDAPLLTADAKLAAATARGILIE